MNVKQLMDCGMPLYLQISEVNSNNVNKVYFA